MDSTDKRPLSSPPTHVADNSNTTDDDVGDDLPPVESTTTALLVCYSPPRDVATLQVDFNEHDERVKREDFRGFRYFPQVPHVCLLLGSGKLLRLPTIAQAVGDEMVHSPVVSHRLDLLAEHVSDAFSNESAANIRAANSARVLAMAGGGATPDLSPSRVIRIEFDDLDSFMLATMRPPRSLGWHGTALTRTQFVAMPLIMSESPSAHADNLAVGLAALLKRTDGAARRKTPFHRFYDTLGTVLYHTDDDDNGLLVRALDSELRRYMDAPDGVDTIDTVRSFSRVRVKHVNALNLRHSWSSGRRGTGVIEKLRVMPDIAPEGSPLLPIDPVEVWADARSMNASKGDTCVVDLNIITACDVNGTPSRFRVTHVARDTLELGIACGHVESTDHDAATADEFVLNLAVRACTEFVEETGTYVVDDEPPVEVRTGVCYLHGHCVTPSVYHMSTTGSKRMVMLGFCVDARHMSVDEIAMTFCGGVPRDVGFESVGRGMHFEAIHEWGTEAATNALNASVKALKDGFGFPLGTLLTCCMRPYYFPPDAVVARVRSAIDFDYRSEDGFFAGAPVAAVTTPPPLDQSSNWPRRMNLPSSSSSSSSSPPPPLPPPSSSSPSSSRAGGAVRRKLVLQKRTNPDPVGGKAGEFSRVF
jgi:hypothetical protein